MEKKQYLRFIATICFITILFVPIWGCVSIEQYPTEWGMLPQSVPNKCDNITGKYINEGTKSRKLDNIFFGQADDPLSKADYTSLECIENSQIKVKVYKAKKILREKVLFLNQDYWCSDQGIELRGPTFTAGAGEGVAGVAVQEQRFYFKKAYDKSLIYQRDDFGAGIVFFGLPFPVIGGRTYWDRFEVISGSEE